MFFAGSSDRSLTVASTAPTRTSTAGFGLRSRADLPRLFSLGRQHGCKQMLSFLLPQGRAQDLEAELCGPEDVRAVMDAYCAAVRDGALDPVDAFWKDCACEIQPSYPALYEEIVAFFARSGNLIFAADAGMRVNPYGQAYSSGKIELGEAFMAGDPASDTVQNVWLNSPVLAYFRSLTERAAFVPYVDLRKVLV